MSADSLGTAAGKPAADRVSNRPDGSRHPELLAEGGDGYAPYGEPRLSFAADINRVGGVNAADFATYPSGTYNPDWDFNADGIVDNADIGVFITAFFGGEAVADLNGNGINDSGYIGRFVQGLLAGC